MSVVVTGSFARGEATEGSDFDWMLLVDGASDSEHFTLAGPIPDASEHVTPHSFRHATAVHLVAAGVDITVIRSWLGHVSLDTTNHYAQANLETKRKALERLANSRHVR